MANDIQFQDVSQFDLERQKLARRRQLAEQMMATRNPKATVQGTNMVWDGPGATLAAGFDRTFGNYQNQQIDEAELQNRMAEREASAQMLSDIPTSGPERQQAQLRAATQMPSLRDAIKLQMLSDEGAANRIAKQQEAEAARIEKGEQEAANRVEKANEGELNRQNRLDLKQTPSIHITNSGGGGGNDLDRQIKEERLRQMKEGKPVVAKPLTQKDRDLQRGFLNLDSALTTYDKLLDSYDTQGGSAVSPTQRAALETAFTDVQMGMKSLYELGAPQAGDMRLLEQSFRNPTSVEGSVRGAMFGKDQYKAKVKQLRTLLGTAKANFEAQTGKTTPEAAVAPTEKKRIKFSELP